MTREMPLKMSRVLPLPIVKYQPAGKIRERAILVRSRRAEHGANSYHGL